MAGMHGPGPGGPGGPGGPHGGHFGPGGPVGPGPMCGSGHPHGMMPPHIHSVGGPPIYGPYGRGAFPPYFPGDFGTRRPPIPGSGPIGPNQYEGGIPSLPPARRISKFKIFVNWIKYLFT